MKKLAMCMVACSLVAGCTTAQLDSFVSTVEAAPTLLLGSHKNPVSRTTLVNAEKVYKFTLGIAKTYRNSCARGLIPQSCRAVVEDLQSKAHYAQDQIVLAREFVKNKDIRAGDVIAAAVKAVNTFRAATPGA